MKTLKYRTFKVEAQGDELYVCATSLKEAQKRLRVTIGDIPEELLTWSEVKEMPAGQVVI